LEASASSASATVSASAAQASQIAAANSAAAAASSFDSFDDRYLGAKSVAPTVDNDGNPLVVGALFYLDTGTAEQIGMYVYDGAGWVKASAAAVASIVTYEYTASGGQTVFSGADDNSVTMTFTSSLIQVFLNGVLLNPGNDFTTGINTVTLVSGAVSGDSLTVVAFASFNVANTYTQAQIDAALALKSPSASPTFTGTVVLPSTTSIGDVSSTEIGYLDGVTSALQTQIDAKLNLAGGKILQIVRATDTTDRTTTSASVTDVTGMSVTITPQKSTSAILIIATGFAQSSWSTGDVGVGLLRITDSSNNGVSGAQICGFGTVNITGTGSRQNQSMFTLIGYATPATTSPVTYKLRFSSESTNNSFTIRNSTATGQMYAIEVSA
jgi:hypothetical protein